MAERTRCRSSCCPRTPDARSDTLAIEALAAGAVDVLPEAADWSPDAAADRAAPPRRGPQPAADGPRGARGRAGVGARPGGAPAAGRRRRSPRRRAGPSALRTVLDAAWPASARRSSSSSTSTPTSCGASRAGCRTTTRRASDARRRTGDAARPARSTSPRRTPPAPGPGPHAGARPRARAAARARRPTSCCAPSPRHAGALGSRRRAHRAWATTARAGCWRSASAGGATFAQDGGERRRSTGCRARRASSAPPSAVLAARRPGRPRSPTAVARRARGERCGGDLDPRLEARRGAAGSTLDSLRARRRRTLAAMRRRPGRGVAAARSRRRRRPRACPRARRRRHAAGDLVLPRPARLRRDLAASVLPGASAPAAARSSVWSAGCAERPGGVGAGDAPEPSSARRLRGASATDLSAAALARARARASTTSASCAGSTPARRAAGCATADGDLARASDALRRHVASSATTPRPTPRRVADGTCALVLCRYVLIYLTPEAADALLERVARVDARRAPADRRRRVALAPLGALHAPSPCRTRVAYRSRDPADSPSAAGGAPAWRRRPPGAATAAGRRAACGLGATDAAATGHAAPRAPRTLPRRHGRAHGPEPRDPRRPGLVRQGEAAPPPATCRPRRPRSAARPTSTRTTRRRWPSSGSCSRRWAIPGPQRAFRAARAAVDRRAPEAVEADLGGFGAASLVRLLAEKLGERP